MDEADLQAAREIVAGSRPTWEQMRADWKTGHRTTEEVLDDAVGELLAERDRLRAVVRKIVACAGIALEGNHDEWLSYACDEYAGRHGFDADELAAYRRARNPGE